VESPDGEFLGQGAAVALDGSPLGFEIGFQLCRPAWGRGVGTRLGRFASAYAIYRCGAYRLEASCLEGHTGSRRILEGLGPKLEGVRPGYRLKEDVRLTELNFGAEISTMDLSEIEGMAKVAGIV
jgi:RimJ/RimL family protein N-acetyltransferase